ncbi:hypothetical protein TVAG_257330 [Trichomonas vaginalis G3]|uniref:Uncharacterized protein n=1 Tax=Trichomonas vaginalis (strain ATCC PRA-98 / G3) TaxID=412133 RepID=A2ELG7_TRIV3|nr:hypothetical protein TVAGG3_0005310 [Trichomonas vaginalis G3]EAY06494.1 hypothetical protein TVAG_257330 [Trichomonas vaginalis G3]KAI5538872.1 hypothetical protein TVAGG3_0005310 [Trichomonas vaginalis G3]|eukprot:XP_001318717.1 hypothetical protein [Trichomonas vaginalis G3]
MRRRFTSQKNTNAKAEITVGYNVNDDKSRIIQNVKVNVSPELTRSATQPNLLTRDLPKKEDEPGKEPVEIPTYPTYPHLFHQTSRTQESTIPVAMRHIK